MSQPFVAILMGSDSDLPIMQAAADVLHRFDIAYELKISSAHRTPERTHQYVRQAEQRGCQVFIAGAGMAAHLAGVVAALTTKPVLGVPLASGDLKGLDALLSTVQMPAGIPVGCLAIGKAGAKNAAYLSAQILALHDEKLAQRLLEHRQEQAQTVAAKDAKLQETTESVAENN